MLNRTLKGIIAAAALTLGAGTAHAQLQGSFCSAASRDGTWAFSFNPGTVVYNCNLVQASLARRSLAPIANWTRGLYWTNGWNQVTAWCFNGTLTFNGFGAQALQNAFNGTLMARGNGCVFTVN